ncbi:MAG: anhydro-N-acetylmuramic acid kinase [Bacteroidales bacterium]|nr:anhydro-N-acetylmuramic acid kinase [Bacteroidales bacterium]
MKILGLMSGTSLDGVDLALCDISDSGYRILAADTVAYPDEWRRRLATLENASALDYALAHAELGHYFGHVVNKFLEGKPRPEAIASHGHTIFHQPDKGLTTQIGDGDAIAAETGLPVVSNFRTLDVALGGQGAPLVPIGDELLFGEYDACLNLGGIANISFRSEVGGRRYERVAFDICPCNMALNRLAAMLGHPYDKGGTNASGGDVHTCLLHELDALEYYTLPGPKSLGKEWFVGQFWPIVKGFLGVTPSQSQVRDALATVTSHIAMQIARVAEAQGIGTLLVTGGGAWNSYLLELLSNYRPEMQVTVPDALIVNYKEALIFALLGYLRLHGKVNTLRSVTGARRDSIGGTLSGLM